MKDKTAGFNATQEFKEFGNSLLNQAKYIQDYSTGNIVDFNKELIRKNPMNSMQTYWQIAQMRKNFVFFMTLPFVISETFWRTWQEVYTPEGKE